MYVYADSKKLLLNYPAMEEVKTDVIAVLRGKALTKHHVVIREIYDDVAEVWRGIGSTECNAHFVMFPYVTIRVRFNVKFRLPC
jgi:hypothetical protein